MDCVIGLTGKDFVLLAADRSQARSIYTLSDEEDKIKVLDDFKLLGVGGDQGDCVAFSEYIQKNLTLHKLRTDILLSTPAAAAFIRGELAYSLRSSPYYVNSLLAGWDDAHGPSLYYLDYLASMQRVPFTANGYASYFILGLMDKYYEPEMSLEEGLRLLNRCVAEVQKRFIVKMPKFIIKVVDSSGVRTLTDDSDVAAPMDVAE